MPQEDNAMLHPHPLTFWVERCPVCSVTLSGWLCLYRAGGRGFFVCPNCESALEVRGRLVMAIFLLLAIGIAWFFLWWFFLYSNHRDIGLLLGWGAAFAFVAFVWTMCAKFTLSIGRKDVDATFVL
jgi:hypothetical protein